MTSRMSPANMPSASDLPRPLVESDLHEPIVLYQGTRTCRFPSGRSVSLMTEVAFHWLPSPEVRASAFGDLDEESRTELFRLMQTQPGEPHLEMDSPSLDELEPFSVARPRLPEPDSPFSTAPRLPREVGHRGSRPDTLTFNIINGPQFWGPVVVNAEGWEIRIDSARNSGRLRTAASDSAGYCTTHQGTLRRVRGGRFAIGAANRVITAINLWMTLLAGRWVGTSLPVASLRGQVAWASWEGPDLVDRSTGTASWFDPTQTKAAAALLPEMIRRCQDPFESSLLRRALWFLVLANHGVPVDVGFTMAVTGLDLLGWAVLVQSGFIKEDDWIRKMKAREKMDRLLTWAQIPTAVPSELRALRKAKPGMSGPECVANLRNDFIHPKPTKKPLPPKAYVDTWLLAAWYLELVTLRWLGYSGRYRPRMAANRWVGATQPLPWAPTAPPES